MKIDNFEINENSRTFIIAELSANHGGNFDVAVETIKAAKEAGADAIKLQTYTADTITINCNNEYFQTHSGTLWEGKTLYDLYKEAYTPWEWQPKLKQIAEQEGLVCFSSPFDNSAVDFLEKMDVPAYKVASFEITDIPLIEYMAEKGKPIIISTGIATLKDIEKAVNACRRKGNENIALLKCTSAYPARIEDSNLKTIKNLKETFGVVPGLSDHTLGITVPVVSVAMGAKIIEKHFILDKSIKSADSGFSLDKHEFTQMVEAVREAELAIGKVDYTLTEKRAKNRMYARSLFVIKDMKEGEMFTKENVKSIRPGNGLAPEFINDILGMKVSKNVKKGTPLSWGIVK